MLTILQSPQSISPAYNDHIFLVESTNYASADFKFIAEIKDNGTTIAILKNPVLNGTDKGVFNVQRIIEAYTGYDFDFENDLTFYTNSVFKYEVEFGDEYLGTEYTNQTSLERTGFNGAMTRKDFSTYASGEWVAHNGGTSKFLTTQRTRRIRQDQWDWLYFLEAPQGLAWYPEYATYKSYSADGTLLKTVTVAYSTGSTNNTYFLGKVPSGRNTSEISSVLSGTLPVIHTAATYYTIAIYDLNDVRITEEYRIDLLDDCSRYDQITVWYLNPMGGFDSFQFDMINRPKFLTQRKQMRRQLYELVGDTYSYSQTRHGLTNYDTRESKSITLNSDWLNDQESSAMHELVSSPVIFIKLGGETDFTPVTINTPDWEQKNENTDGLFNAQIEVQFDVERRQGA